MDGRKALGGLQVLILALMLIDWIAPVASQSDDRFLIISIDCGADEGYHDSTTNITWETDDKYISVGKNEHGVTFPSGYVNVVNRRQAETLRYFDEGRSRYCYVLPVKPMYSYLLRADFFYGNWRQAGLVSFDVYLNATFWVSVTVDSDIAQDKFYFNETLLYSTGTSLTLCLVTRDGTPFISALELRELSNGMYSTVVGTATLLSLFGRENAGAPEDGPTFVRYPDDDYDRVWAAGFIYRSSTGRSAPSISNTNISSSNAAAPNQPPVAVMKDAWINYDDPKANFLYYRKYENFTGSQKFQIYGYFQELDGNASASNVRGMNYIVNDDIVNPFNTTNEPQQIGSAFTVSPDKQVINITVAPADWSNLETMTNAYELYYSIDINTSMTAPEDLDAIDDLKRRLNLTNWNGDPCFPVPYDWLSCTFVSATSSVARVTQLFPSRIEGPIESTPLEISNLTALTYLNISYDNLTPLPTDLKVLNLRVLDVSYNRLGGNISNFFDAINLNTLRELYAQENQFEGEFQIDLLTQQKNLQIGNFDRNLNINGRLNLNAWHTSLKTAVQRRSPSELQLFSLADNNITDIYPKVDDMKFEIEAILNFEDGIGLEKGILLGGNPYCRESKSKSLAEDYLCRSFVNKNDTRFQPRSSKSDQNILAIVLGSCAGAFVVFVLCICLPILWKLRKQTYALVELQEALAQRQVQPPFYSYKKLRAATRDFSPDNKLGEGGFGTVYKAVEVDGTMLAVKKLKITKQVMEGFLNEVVLITGIKHRHLVQLKGCCIKENQRILVYEYAENGNLAEALWERNGNSIKLDWQNRFDICVGVARGLAYLHEELQPRIIHRDIKPANILIDKTLNAKIADFGLARLFMDDQSHADFSHLAGTMGYCAPEYASQGQLTEKADVFSFGTLLLEIVSGRKSIDPKLPIEKRFLLNLTKELKIQGKLLDLLEPAIRASSNGIDDEVLRVIDIALLCLDNEPRRRPAMSHIVTMLQGSMDVAFYMDSANFNNRFVDTSSSFNVSHRTETLSQHYSMLDHDSNTGSSSLTQELHSGGAMDTSVLSAR